MPCQPYARAVDAACCRLAPRRDATLSMLRARYVMIRDGVLGYRARECCREAFYLFDRARCQIRRRDGMACGGAAAHTVAEAPARHLHAAFKQRRHARDAAKRMLPACLGGVSGEREEKRACLESMQQERERCCAVDAGLPPRHGRVIPPSFFAFSFASLAVLISAAADAVALVTLEPMPLGRYSPGEAGALLLLRRRTLARPAGFYRWRLSAPPARWFHRLFAARGVWSEDAPPSRASMRRRSRQRHEMRCPASPRVALLLLPVPRGG